MIFRKPENPILRGESRTPLSFLTMGQSPWFRIQFCHIINILQLYTLDIKTFNIIKTSIKVHFFRSPWYCRYISCLDNTNLNFRVFISRFYCILILMICLILSLHLITTGKCIKNIILRDVGCYYNDINKIRFNRGRSHGK